MNIEEIEANYYKELDARREIAKNFKGQVAGRHPDALNNYEIHAMVRGYLEGYQKAKETFLYTEEDMIAFAEFVAKYPDKNRNVYGKMLHASSKYDGAEPTYSLLEIWKKQQNTVYY